MATFGPRRIAAFRALWKALTRGGRRVDGGDPGWVEQTRRPGAPAVGDQLRALPRMVGAAVAGRYPGRGRIALMVLALAYLVSPVDLVPEVFLGLLGLTDDAVVALWLGGSVLAETDRYLEWERGRVSGAAEDR